MVTLAGDERIQDGRGDEHTPADVNDLDLAGGDQLPDLGAAHTDEALGVADGDGEGPHEAGRGRIRGGHLRVVDDRGRLGRGPLDNRQLQTVALLHPEARAQLVGDLNQHGHRPS